MSVNKVYICIFFWKGNDINVAIEEGGAVGQSCEKKKIPMEQNIVRFFVGVGY